MSDTTTPPATGIREKAAAALALAEAATPDWRVEMQGPYPLLIVGPRTVTLWHSRNADQQRQAEADSRFAAAARGDVPALAEFVLRITGPEMRDRLVRFANERLVDMVVLRATNGQIADAIMALLTAEPAAGAAS